MTRDAPVVDDYTLARLTTLLRARAGLELPPSRAPDAAAALARATARSGLRSADEYLAAVEAGAAPVQELIDQLTVQETYFFRTAGQFDLIRRLLRQRVIARGGVGVRAWSAGCATGEEAYSLAILFEQEGIADLHRILATDVSRGALERARRAIYRAWSFRDVDPGIVRGYFRAVDDTFVLEPRIRDRVAFAPLNLADPVYPQATAGTAELDLILCRNVFIYLSAATIRDVAARLHACLADGGWLVTSPTDPPLAELAPFHTVITDGGVVYHRGPVSDATAAAVGGVAAAPPGAVVAPIRRDDDSSAARRRKRTTSTRRKRPSSGLHTGGASGLRASRPAIAAAPRPEARAEREAAALSAEQLRALADRAPALAEAAAREATARHPLSAELHLLRGIVLYGQSKADDAAGELRRALFLDRSLAIGHYLLARIHRERGQLERARACYDAVRRLCAARPADEVVPHAEGVAAGVLAAAADTEIRAIDAADGARRRP